MNLQWNETLEDGAKVQIRPMTIADLDRERSFVASLSPETKHFRFLAGVNQLSEQELAHLCDVDQDQDMAFVATVDDGNEVTQVGVSRYASEHPSSKDCEIAVTVADTWQRKGIGTSLLRHLIDYAKSRGVQSLYSIELADNPRMRRLADKFGFTSAPDPEDARQIIYTLDLDSTAPTTV